MLDWPSCFVFDRRANEIRRLKDSVFELQSARERLTQLKEAGSGTGVWLVETALRRKEQELRDSMERLGELVR